MNRRIMGCLLTAITLSMLAACSNKEPAASQPSAEPAAVVEPSCYQHYHKLSSFENTCLVPKY